MGSDCGANSLTGPLAWPLPSRRREIIERLPSLHARRCWCPLVIEEHQSCSNSETLIVAIFHFDREAPPISYVSSL